MPRGKVALLDSSTILVIPTASHKNGWLANQWGSVYSRCDLSRLARNSLLIINLNAMGKSMMAKRDIAWCHVLTHGSLVLPHNPVIVVNPIAKAISVHHHLRKRKSLLDSSLSPKKISMRRIYDLCNRYMTWSKSSHLSKRCSTLSAMHHWSTNCWIAWIWQTRRIRSAKKYSNDSYGYMDWRCSNAG